MIYSFSRKNIKTNSNEIHFDFNRPSTLLIFIWYEYNFNEIKIKIKGNGLQKICEDPIPIEIYLYNKTHGFTKKWGGINTLTLDDEESTLLLKFNQPMNAAGLFMNMENITYIKQSLFMRNY